MAKKNLLDAFQRIAAEQQRTDAPTAVHAPTPEPLQAPASRSMPTWAPRAALALVVVFAAGFATGRLTSREAPVEAGAPAANLGAVHLDASSAPRSNEVASQPPAPRATTGTNVAASVPPVVDAPRPDAGETAGARFERALRDPANRYTIQVISYANQPAQRVLAQELAEHFRSMGLEASDPWPTGRHLVVLVGVAPTEAAIKPTLERVRGARDPRGRAGQFGDALVLPISNFLPR